MKREIGRLARTARTAGDLQLIAWELGHHLREPAAGLPYARRAVEADPRCWQCLDTLAWMASEQGDPGEALGLQERALNLMGEHDREPEVTARLRLYRAAVLAAKNPPIGD